MNHARRRGFTLVELLVVLAIIGILVALLLPAVQAAREAARRASCFNNLKQLGLALQQFEGTYGSLPAGYGARDPASGQPDPNGVPGWGWAAKVLPYLELRNVQDNLIRFDLPIADPFHDAVRVFPLPGFRCPSDAGRDTFLLPSAASPTTTLMPLARSNYVGSFGTTDLDGCATLGPGVECRGNGVLFHNSHVRFADITDGLSQTFFVGERSSRLGGSTWIGMVRGGQDAIVRVLGSCDHSPNHPSGHLDDFGSYHPAGTNFLLGDGSVRLVLQSIHMDVYQALATREASDIVTGDF